MAKWTRRGLLMTMGVGAAAGWNEGAIGYESQPGRRVPKALVTSTRVRLLAGTRGDTKLVVHYGGTLEVKGEIRTLVGQVRFVHEPSQGEAAAAIRARVRLDAAKVHGVSLAPEEISVVGPVFL